MKHSTRQAITDLVIASLCLAALQTAFLTIGPNSSYILVSTLGPYPITNSTQPFVFHDAKTGVEGHWDLSRSTVFLDYMPRQTYVYLNFSNQFGSLTPSTIPYQGIGITIPLMGNGVLHWMLTVTISQVDPHFIETAQTILIVTTLLALTFIVKPNLLWRVKYGP